MENSLIPIKELQKFIVKDFQVDENELLQLEDFESIKSKLSSVINYLLDKDINKLLNIFYKLDLKEQKVVQILTSTPVREISVKLAELVVEREIDKINTRLKYRSSPS
jgi:hypothetical protein